MQLRTLSKLVSLAALIAIVAVSCREKPVDIGPSQSKLEGINYSWQLFEVMQVDVASIQQNALDVTDAFVNGNGLNITFNSQDFSYSVAANNSPNYFGDGGSWEFNTNDYSTSGGGTIKRVNLYSSSQNVIAIANFGMSEDDGRPNFPHTGWWYEHFSGDSINVTDLNMNLYMDAGEYMLWSDQKMEGKFASVSNITLTQIKLYPNPATDQLFLTKTTNEAMDFEILDSKGMTVQKRKTC